MISRLSSPRAILAGALLALIPMMSGCGGGASSSLNAIPGAAQPAGANLTPQSETYETVAVSKADNAMAKVTDAAAYYSPMEGQRVPAMRGLQPQAFRSTMAASDLTNYGGPTVRSEAATDIYVNCGSASCWGAPGTFLSNLASTSFIHLLDQYTGSTANSRYTYGGGVLTNYNTSGTLQDQDIYNLVHAAAVSRGGGYGHIYNVFLMNGVHQCSSSAGGCYGVQYCAYHGAVNFSDIGHTLYSVEPYQGINGCMVPNGRLADSTNSTLSHEYYEIITDPDVQTNVAWYNNTSGEIGDICRNSTGYVTVGGTSFDLQKEYSNRYHACSFSP